MDIKYIVLRFKQPYIVSADCLGKSISISTRDSKITADIIKCTILFPCRDSQNDTFLKSPVSELFLGVSLDWGKIHYSGLDAFPYIRGIVVRLECSSVINSSKCREFIGNKTNRILKTLRYLHPYAVEREREDSSLISSIIINNGKSEIELDPLHVIFDKQNDLISIKDILNAIRNENKVFSLPLQLFDFALDNKFTSDYRACILYCASLTEILLKRDLEKHLDDCITSEKLRNRLIKDSNSYSKIIRYLKNVSVLPNIDAKGLFDTRNKIIHGGYVPTEIEASDAIKVSKAFIDYYHINIYE